MSGLIAIDQAIEYHNRRPRRRILYTAARGRRDTVEGRRAVIAPSPVSNA